MRKQVEKVDLRTVDPKGRIDVLTFRGAEKLAKYIEEKTGLAGIWDCTQEQVHEIVVKGLSGVEVPGEIKMLMALFQANIDKVQGIGK